MIEKFNFYDVYGYFVPGAAFIAILWLPFGLVRHAWPSSTWSGAIIAAVLAYIGGHLIQSLATNALPSRDNEGRFPSETYLDPDDKELPSMCKKNIQELVDTQFGLKLEVDKKGNDAIDKQRHNAFLLARQILIQGKAASYAEQSQGMYALTRGLVSVLFLTFAYWLGFAAPAFVRQCVATTAILLGLTVSLLVLANLSLVLLETHPLPLTKRRMELGYSIVLVLACLLIGYALGLHCQVSQRYGTLLLFLSAWAFIAALRAYGAYKSFAGQFAATVWRDYLAYNVSVSLHQKSDDTR
ncbi:MAG: hypothetical protein ACRD3B_13645 [Candidatus Sulfotelmatobacter sp.]